MAGPLWMCFCRGSSLSKVSLHNTSFPVTLGAQSRAQPGEVPGEQGLCTALCVSPVSSWSWCHLLTSSLVLLLLPPRCSQCHGGTGLCPGTLAAAGRLGTCTPVDGLEVEHTENFLCWEPCVHVGLLCMCHPCSSLHIPLLSQLLLLMFGLGLRNHSSCFYSALIPGLTMSPGCLKVGSGGAAPAGCDGTFSAWSPLQQGVGNQTLAELCHSQKINPGNPHGGDLGMSRGVDFGGRFFPKMAFTFLWHSQAIISLCFFREEAEGEGSMDEPFV